MRQNVETKFISTDDVYRTIERCRSRRLRVTYCSLNLNNQCVNTKNAIIRITKINRNCGYIEGLILRNNEPFENIVLKDTQILSLQCVQEGPTPGEPSIFDIIRNCRGLVRITQCVNLEQGECKNRRTFPFVVTQIDERNKNIRGYRIRANGQTEFMIIDTSLILRVECLSPQESFNIPGNLPGVNFPPM